MNEYLIENENFKIFPNSFENFRKWTFINVQNQKKPKGLAEKREKVICDHNALISIFL